MLLDFVFKNFLSYENETYFSMEAGERLVKYSDTHTTDVNNRRILKSSIAFGANASGKSNLIKALMTLQTLVLQATTSSVQEMNYSPFILRKGRENKPTEFLITLLSNGTIYRYKIIYDQKKVIHETLEYEKRGKFVVHFARKAEEWKTPKELESFVKNTRDNQLFLFVAQDKNDKRSGEVFQWFAQDLIIFQNSIPNNLFTLLEDKVNKNIFLNFMRAADIHITDIDIREQENPVPSELRHLLSQFSGNEVPSSVKSKQLYLMHASHTDNNQISGNVPIALNLESQGTQKIVAIALLILHRKTQSKVIVIDEFDDSFHLELSKAILDVIHTKGNINQFILTTHELQLMDQHLRKDQIYFAQKNHLGSSELFSLFDFDDERLKRSDVKYMTRYLKGQFGAGPVILLDGLIQALSDSVEEAG